MIFTHFLFLIIIPNVLHLSISQRQPGGFRRGPYPKVWDLNQRDVHLDCFNDRILHEAPILWIKDGKDVLANDRILINKERGFRSRLTFRFLKMSDEGSYQCEAFDRLSISFPAKVKITTPPPIVNAGNPLPLELSLRWDDKFALQCEGKGPPDITRVEWTYKAFVTQNGEQRIALAGNIIQNIRNPSLKSLPLQYEAMQLGVTHYEVFCTVHNRERSQNSRKTTIFIIQRPQTPIIDHVSTLDTRKEIILFWKVASTPTDVETCVAYISGAGYNKTLTIPYCPAINEQIIGGLVPEHSYSIRIRCVSALGISDYSESYNFITVSDAPSNVTVESLNTTSVRLSWGVIPSHLFDGLLKGYRIILVKRQGAKLRREVASDERVSVFHDLIPGGTYGASVRGFTTTTEGPYSTMKYVMQPLLEKPYIGVSYQSEKQVIFTIQDVNVMDGSFRNCSLFLAHGVHNTIVDVQICRNATNKTMVLKQNTVYTVKVGCYTHDMKSIFSDAIQFRTKEGAPSHSPKNMTLEVFDHSILVKWSPVTRDLNGHFTSYKICKISTALKPSENNVCVLSAKTVYNFSDVEADATYAVLVSACTKAGCGPNESRFISTDNWFASTTSGPNGTLPKAKSTAAALIRVDYTSASTLIYIVIAVLMVVAIFIIVAVLAIVRKTQAKDPNNGRESLNMSMLTACEQPYEVPLLHPTWTEANARSDKSTSPYVSLSDETYDKLADVKYSCDHVTVKDVIGRGQFGKVYRAEFSPSKWHDGTTDSDHIQVAVKTMIMQQYEQTEYEEFVREGLRMKNMDHPNVMRLLGICLPTESNTATNNLQSNETLSGPCALSPWIIIPIMPNGDLKRYLCELRQNGKMVELKQILHFAHDIACGMKYITEKKIIHRDLACRNCMLDANMNVVISDFGLSRKVYSRNYYRQRHVAKVPVKWMAMESLMDNMFTSMTDVWSFGITAWELFTLCQSPYPSVANHDMLRILQAGRRLEKPDLCPSNVWHNAIYPCWDPRCEERPTFGELAELFAGFKSFYSGFMTESSPDHSDVNVEPDVKPECEESKLLNTSTL